MGDYRTTTGEDLPATPRQRRVRRRRVLLVVLGLSLVLAVAGTVFKTTRRVRAAGYVTMEDYAEVRAPAQGIVATILVSSGTQVAEGDVLVQLDNRIQLAQLEEARSQVRKAQSELARRQIEIEEALRAHHDGLRLLVLREQHGAVKRERVEDLQAQGLAAQAEVEDQRLLLELLREELGAQRNRDLTVFDRQLDVLRHEVESRQETVERLAAQVALCEVRAPIAGQTVRYEFVAGELVRPDTVLYEIYGGERQVLKVRVPERHATRVAPGQPYRARLLSYGGLKATWFRGEVMELRNTIQGSGAQTYRTAYCTFDGNGHDVPPGATAEAWIDAGPVPLWSYLLGID